MGNFIYSQKIIAVAAAIATSSCIIFTTAFAQNRVVNGVTIREELKGSSGVSSAGEKASMVPTTYVKRCDTNGVCQTPLLVFSGGIGQDGKWDSTRCSVYWPYYQIRVGPSWQPILRWVLTKDSGDLANYSFDSNLGIGLIPAQENDGDQNDPREDLYKPIQEGTDGSAFVWHNFHAGTKEKAIYFVPKVYRNNKDLRKRITCYAADPEVVNEN